MGAIKDEIRRCAKLSDDELCRRMPELARGEREGLVRFLIHLGEVHERNLHVARAYPGLFSYLRELGYTEWESRARALATVAWKKYRSILGLLRAGRLTLGALAMIAPHLNSENHKVLLRKACRRSTREIQALLAGLSPQPKRRDVVRVVSAPSPLEPTDRTLPDAAASEPTSSSSDNFFPELAPPSQTPPEAAARRWLRYHFDADEDLDRLLQRARELLSNKYIEGRMEDILRDALEALLDRADPERRFARRVARARAAARRVRAVDPRPQAQA